MEIPNDVLLDNLSENMAKFGIYTEFEKNELPTAYLNGIQIVAATVPDLVHACYLAIEYEQV